MFVLQQRNIPARGFRPFYYLLGANLIMAYGYYKLFYGIREKKYVLDVAPLIYSILLRT